ncbi:hypothetical protein EYF80_033047 [Liparis tanakae]|uniref:Uncharacterized protein n=1 Tax=Liparis tanakae TaxID=230148 RepID=A0A4Z2GVD9_9TELE|nr:hypothetical protein EYF80_033047 [Liparis tanakae]
MADVDCGERMGEKRVIRRLTTRGSVQMMKMMVMKTSRMRCSTSSAMDVVLRSLLDLAAAVTEPPLLRRRRYIRNSWYTTKPLHATVASTSTSMRVAYRLAYARSSRK